MVSFHASHLLAPAPQRAQTVAQADTSQNVQKVTQATLVRAQFVGAPENTILCVSRNDAFQKIRRTPVPPGTTPQQITYIWPSDSRFEMYATWICKEGARPESPASLNPLVHYHMNLQTPDPEILKKLDQFEDVEPFDEPQPSPEILRNLGLPEDALNAIPESAICENYDQACTRRTFYGKNTYIWPSTRSGMISVMPYNSNMPKRFYPKALARVIKNFTWAEPQPKKRTVENAGVAGVRSDLKQTLRDMGITDDILSEIPEGANINEWKKILKGQGLPDDTLTLILESAVDESDLKHTLRNMGVRSSSQKSIHFLSNSPDIYL